LHHSSSTNLTNNKERNQRRPVSCLQLTSNACRKGVV